MNQMTRSERWDWVQTLPPMRTHFEKSLDRFLNSLPTHPLTTAQLVRLAFYAGANASFQGLAEHERRTAGWGDDDTLFALRELALEPMEYLHRNGVVVE